MLNEKHGDGKVISHPAEEFNELQCLGGIHSGSRFVEKEERWLERHGADDFQTALGTLRQSACLLVHHITEAKLFEQLGTHADVFFFSAARRWKLQKSGRP